MFIYQSFVVSLRTERGGEFLGKPRFKRLWLQQRRALGQAAF